MAHVYQEKDITWTEIILCPKCSVRVVYYVEDLIRVPELDGHDRHLVICPSCDDLQEMKVTKPVADFRASLAIDRFGNGRNPQARRK